MTACQPPRLPQGIEPPVVETDYWPPPNIPNPSFDFRQLGVRIPAILVSAYFDAQTDDTLYEHASIPAVLNELYGLNGPGPGGYLTLRDQAANTFVAKNLTRSTPRKDVLNLEKCLF